MQKRSNLNEFLKEVREVPNLELLERASEHKRYSRDFFEYSPILKEELALCRADCVLKPFSIDAVIAVAKNCRKHEIPLTLRGSGTGNYGQCVPLHGGVVMLMTSLKSIRSFDMSTGVVTVEAGCLLGDLNKYLLEKGRQLRLVPSTWQTASVAGFIAGGSGGIGSVRWGFLRDPGHLLGLEVITLEDLPKKIELEAKSSEALNHAYGTNGIITALTLATCPAVDWQEISLDCENLNIGIELLQACTRAAVNLFLCSFLEKRIIESIPTWSGGYKGKHRLLLLVDPDGCTTIERLALDFGADYSRLGSEKENIGNGLRELTWNHTTLHMRAIDSEWTYLQMLLPQPEINLVQKLNRKWGKNILWHLEGVRQHGVQRIAALPLVRWQGRQKLKELMEDCSEAGAILFNPHVITVEDGGLGVIDSDQVEAKKNFDPKGILNPGKLKGWVSSKS